MRRDPVKVAIYLGVYIVLFFLSTIILSWVLLGAGYLVGIIAITTLSAIFANWLALRIFEGRHLIDAGLWWNRASSENLGFGLLGGAGAACLVLLPPVLIGAAHFSGTPEDQPTFGTILFVLILLIAGVIGEELLFRGYGFQLLLSACGPYITIISLGALFALLHGRNPNADWFGLLNTAGFGILFGYAYFRSRDLWLPIGLHLGWNVMLPVFGVNLSGLRMRITGYEMSWTAGRLWSGGEYGPEASVLTSVVLLLLFFYLLRIPVRRQFSPVTDPPLEKVECEPSRPLPS
jgi:membrane protease YdiL (CAAX protease family)